MTNIFAVLSLFFRMTLILSLMTGVAAPSISFAQQITGRDLTSDYRQLMSSDKTIWRGEHSSALKKYKIIFVPGFLSTVILGLGSHKLARIANLGEYFDEQIKWLNSQGIESERIGYAYEGEPGENAPVVEDAIRRSTKPVLVVAHSKGGLDTISALIKMNPSLRDKVRGFIAIQVPFYGSPVASCFNEIQAKRDFAKWALSSLNVSFGALESLDLRRRMSSSPAMRDETSFMETLSRSIPVISFASYKTKEIDSTNAWQLLTGQDTLMFHSRTIMEKKYGLKNDGLVPVSSAMIPGSDFIITGDVDHAVPVMYCQILRFDRLRFFQSVLRLVLTR